MIAFIRSGIAVALLALATATTLLAADSDKPLVENERVRVTRIDLGPGESLPNTTQHDAITVQVADGKTVITAAGKKPKDEPGKSGHAHYFAAGSDSKVRNAGTTPVTYVQIEFLQPQGKYAPLDVPRTHYCNPDDKKACVTEKYQFCTDHFCTEWVELTPGAVSTQHSHDSDHILIPTSTFTWREEIPGKSPANFGFKPGEAQYYQAGVTHRLINTGTTTASMFVIQYK